MTFLSNKTATGDMCCFVLLCLKSWQLFHLVSLQFFDGRESGVCRAPQHTTQNVCPCLHRNTCKIWRLVCAAYMCIVRCILTWDNLDIFSNERSTISVILQLHVDTFEIYMYMWFADILMCMYIVYVILYLLVCTLWIYIVYWIWVFFLSSLPLRLP